MSYFCSIPPKFTFLGCSEEFLIPVAKIQNIYHIDNQFVINFKPISRLSLFILSAWALSLGSPNSVMLTRMPCLFSILTYSALASALRGRSDE